MGYIIMGEQRFRPEKLFITATAAKAFEEAGEQYSDYLLRHVEGDWGELNDELRCNNDINLGSGKNLLSAFTLKKPG